MAYFEWGEDMAIDHGPIDRDHQHLVDLVNQLHTATSQGQGQTVVAAILQDLLAYTQDHLRREEAEMAAAHYPDLAAHQKTHQRFMDGLEDLRHRYEAGSITVAAQLSALLRDWLSLHIRRSDKDLRRHLQRR